MVYIWQRSEWPKFRWDEAAINKIADEGVQSIAEIVKEVNNLPEGKRQEKIIDFMVAEAIKTSEIEGEFYSRADVRSSISNQMYGLAPPTDVKDKRAIGVSNLMVDCRRRYDQPLTVEQLCEWQRMVVSGAIYNRPVAIGRLRERGVVVHSSTPTGQRIHYEAPPPDQVPEAIERFIQWFNISSLHLNSIIRAGVSHVYFESIHPFDDGNGRVGRAIVGVALSQGLGYPAPLSMSTVIMRRRDDYNRILESAQSGNLDITNWLLWFADTVKAAQVHAMKQARWVLFKTNILDQYADDINERQATVVGRLFRDEIRLSEGGFGVEEYMDMVKCGEAEAKEDMMELLALGVFEELKKFGRRRRYDIRPESEMLEDGFDGGDDPLAATPDRTEDGRGEGR